VTVHIAPLSDGESTPMPDAGLGSLTTDKGNLPLDTVDISAAITGLTAGIELVQGFHNPFDVPLEATYVFPLPDRAAVIAMRMAAADRTIEGTLKERAQARADYDTAIAAGRRAAIAEEDRPDVFTMRVGNILPGERVTVTLRLSQPLPYEDAAATFRFPLVVAPRYIPGRPLDDAPAGGGVAPDTDAVPDASRISPPVLLPGFPNPVRLALSVDIDPAGLPLTEIRSSLHVVETETANVTSDAADTGRTDGTGGRTTIRLRPGERLDRDFVLRLGFAPSESASLAIVPDEAGEAREATREGTFTLTVLPSGEVRPRPRDVVLVLDRSGSMTGWKIVAARRAAARIIDTLTAADRFAVLCFDHMVDRPAELPEGLSAATDRNRFRAVEHLARLDSRGGTEMLGPLQEAAGLLGDSGRDRVLVLITDGQVGNEDQILAGLTPVLGGVRVHTVGIDRAVNAGFLGRLAAIGQGRCELVESEDRLDEAMDHIHHRIGAPLVTGLSLEATGLELVPDTVTPSRLGALFPGVPLVIAGRWQGAAAEAGGGALTVRGLAADGTRWEHRAPATIADEPAAVAVWARAHLRELEDRYVTAGTEELEKRIVDTSLRFGVLCRFTAFVAVDSRVVAAGRQPHQVIQPVEQPDGWAYAAIETAAAPLAAPAGAVQRGQIKLESGRMPESVTKVYRAAGGGRRGFSRPGPATRPAQPAAGTPPPDALTVGRQQLRQEVEQLTRSAALPEDAHRRLLSDLRARLNALVIHLEGAGAAEDVLAPLVSLVEDLRAVDDPSGALDISDLWDRTVRVLTEFATGEPSRKRAFWKRHP
jgi:Ca-activated chloride channel homolog